MARAADTEENGGLRFALARVADDVSKAEEKVSEIGQALQSHMLRCESAALMTHRDLSDLSKQVEALNAMVRKGARWGGPVILIMFAIQMFGFENAFGVFKMIKGLH